MITTNEFLLSQGILEENLQNLPWFDYGNISTWLEEYAKEAIKADRINLLNYLKYFPDYTLNSKEDDLQRKQIQDSIINAPNIELK